MVPDLQKASDMAPLASPAAAPRVAPERAA